MPSEEMRPGEACRLIIDSHIVECSPGDSGNGAVVTLPCEDFFGGVDSIRRVNPTRVEVFTWRLET